MFRRVLRQIAAGAGLIVLLIVAVVGIGITVANVIRQPGQGTFSEVAASECQAAYRRAATPAESVAVGRMRPITSRGQAPRALSCAVMRERGWLR